MLLEIVGIRQGKEEGKPTEIVSQTEDLDSDSELGEMTSAIKSGRATRPDGVRL